MISSQSRWSAWGLIRSDYDRPFDSFFLPGATPDHDVHQDRPLPCLCLSHLILFPIQTDPGLRSSSFLLRNSQGKHQLNNSRCRSSLVDLRPSPTPSLTRAILTQLRPVRFHYRPSSSDASMNFNTPSLYHLLPDYIPGREALHASGHILLIPESNDCRDFRYNLLYTLL